MRAPVPMAARKRAKFRKSWRHGCTLAKRPAQ